MSLTSATLLLITIQTVVQAAQEFRCIQDFQITKQGRGWEKNIKYALSRNLKSVFTDWVIELQLDVPAERMDQHFGVLVDESRQIKYKPGTAFFIKSRSHRSIIRRSSIRFDVTFQYEGYAEPQIKLAALCGMTDSTVVYPTLKPTTEILPTLPKTTPSIPKCVMRTSSRIEMTSQDLQIPITEDTSSWVIELEFDSKWNYLSLRTECTKLKSDGLTLICASTENNRRLAKGRTFSFSYYFGYSRGHSSPKLISVKFNSYGCKP
uniref:Cnidarian restricted protein n=1 Tax=Clytia hemisphaerica TaxID=252671 RepID=A0A7M5X349_9CNID